MIEIEMMGTERTIERSEVLAAAEIEDTPALAKPVVSFDIDRLRIYGVQKKNVFVIGEVYGQLEDVEEECCIIIPRPAFNRAMKQWLDTKARYSSWYQDGSMAGVGSVNVLDPAEQTVSIKMIGLRCGDVTTKTLRTFRCTELEVDMEHG